MAIDLELVDAMCMQTYRRQAVRGGAGAATPSSDTTHSLHRNRSSSAVHQTGRGRHRACVRSSMPEAGDKLRVLALHSWRTSGSIFVEQVCAVLSGCGEGSSCLASELPI